ncbi:MAG: M15 family metallopeptidase [Labilithrix sp.]|nr:M15 family metallopeptidase [Labilithrix sp.]MCW5816138.1 M15 family metallopeptidase [Labilithrix sp.]
MPAVVLEGDGRAKTMAERIARPDLEDVFALPYPTGPIVAVSDPEHDPGRVRIEAVFDATYGAGASAIARALVPVRFGGRTVSFHRKAAPALERVAKRLEPLVGQPATARFFAKLGGTFAYREIAGTNLRSTHSWGIAIDLDPAACEYWRNGPQPPVWKNRVPQAIVDAFEAEGFVWGGRWYHYDTMHFEYRPELFSCSRGLCPLELSRRGLSAREARCAAPGPREVGPRDGGSL